jgi:DNA-directed RNA polymerase specialized sigma24 family protein
MLIEPYVTTLTDTPATNDVADAAEAIDATSSFNYEQTLHDCARGDRQALQRLYRQEARRLLGVALRIVRQRQQAEDVVHDAFMNIWTKAVSFDAALGSGRGWIYSITRNLALNAVRNGAREVTVDEETTQALDA